MKYPNYLVCEPAMEPRLTPRLMPLHPQSTRESMKSNTMSPCYLQKTVGPMAFYSCQACPFMAMAEIDVKSHLFISHPELVKTISFLKDVRLQCPGCGVRFDSEASIKMHLRIHHKMGLKDMKKLLKTLITVALKNTNQETTTTTEVATTQQNVSSPVLDKTLPFVIEITHDNSKNEVLPSGISVISLDELQKLKTMSTPIEKDDPKKIIEEACINIVYIDERNDEYNYTTEQHIVKTPERLSSNSSTTVNSQMLGNTAAVPNLNTPCLKNQPSLENKQYNSSTRLIDFYQSKDYKIKNVTAQGESNNNIPVPLESNNIVVPVEFQMKDARSGELKLKNNIKTKSVIEDNSGELKCAFKKSEIKSLKHNRSAKEAKIKPSSTDCKKKTLESNVISDNKKENSNKKTEKELITQIPSPETPSIKTQPSDVGKLKCSYKDCKVSLNTIENMKYHSICHQDGMLRCPECKQSFFYPAPLHQHLWKCHNIDMDLYACDECGYKTVSKCRLEKNHKMIHTTVRSHRCSICSKVFKSSKQLSNHKAIHIDTKFSCEKCKREFRTELVLRRHIQVVHENVKPYRCELCQYSSSTNNDLRIHIRVHNGEKPFACEECPFKAADPKSFRRHQKVHSGNYKYNCQYCDYRCIQTISLKKHILSKHGDVEEEKTVLSCPFCVHTSINRATFVTHLSKHIDLKEKKSEDKTILESNEETKLAKNDAVRNQADEHVDKTFEDLNEMTKEDSGTTNVLIELEDNDTCHELANTCNTHLNEFTNEHIDLFTDSFFNMTPITTDLTQDDNISECIVSESSNDTILEMMEPVQSIPRSLPMFVSNNSLGIKQGIPLRMVASAQNNAHTQMMNSFPIRLPMNSQSVSNGHFRLTPFDKIPLPGSKVYGSQIRTTQMLTVPTHGTCNQNRDLESIPRKKPKISVKSNLILKGPDKVNMFRLEDDEHHIDSTDHTPITLNNLINRQLMQLNPDSALVNSQGTGLLQNMLPYADTMLDSAGTPQGDSTPTTPQLFNFNQQGIDTADLNLMSRQMQPGNLVQCNNNANYIKLEAQQSFQLRTHALKMFPDDSLLCGSDLLQDYCKTSPPLEEIHKNDNEIKNEMKSDVFLQTHKMQNDSVRNSPMINNSNLIDNLIGSNEIYGGHINLMVLPSMIESVERAEIIELEDKKQNNYTMNFPRDSGNGYYPNIDFQLENDLSPVNPVYAQPETISDFDTYTRDSSRVLTDLNQTNYDQNRIDMNFAQPLIVSNDNNDFSMDNYVLERRDPMMNTTVRPAMTKINVKNIELMKNNDCREQH